MSALELPVFGLDVDGLDEPDSLALLESFAPLDSLALLLASFAFEPDSLADATFASFESFESFVDESESLDELAPLLDDDFDRESVTYHPLPLNTMPTGWMFLRNVPPHFAQMVSGGSVKLWRVSTWSLHAVQV